MHIAQIMLVEAETSSEAHESVRSVLDDCDVWFDWYAVENENLAGRFTGKFGVLNDNLRYSDNPDLAQKLIDEYFESRLAAIQECRQSLSDGKFDLLEVEYDLHPTSSFESGALRHLTWQSVKLSQMLADYWVPESGLYDITEHTASLRYAFERIEKDPTNQFLVLVDFHY